MDKYCWNEGQGLYFDYDTKAERQTRYESVTTLWPLWAGCASEHQAMKLAMQALPKFEVAGGLVSGTEESRGTISLDRPNRQWGMCFSFFNHQLWKLAADILSHLISLKITPTAGRHIKSWHGLVWRGMATSMNQLV